MPFFELPEEIAFPSPELADDDGLLAMGGDLSPERLLLAYCNGIFPWYSDDDPILWWSPDPRFVLFPDKLKLSESMARTIKSNRFAITFDRDFPAVISHCRKAPRKNQPGTWITLAMKKAYQRLHDLGIAHSVEAWRNGKLAGGLYGVLIGSLFFGESMFSLESNASKAALFALARNLHALGCPLIDCQTHTRHLESLGAEFMERKEFLDVVKEAVDKPLLMDFSSFR